jgi:hypothetical protein
MSPWVCWNLLSRVTDKYLCDSPGANELSQPHISPRPAAQSIFLCHFLNRFTSTNPSPTGMSSDGKEETGGADSTPSNKPVVLVIGLTGAGKTTFVNLITGGKNEVGRDLSSCTRTCTVSSAIIDGIDVDFVDTPGYEDPDTSDAQVLIDLVGWIGENLKGKRPITAALYLHSIQHNRVYESALRNFTMFSELIGSENMKNVGLVSTHWNTVPLQDGETRELYLIAKPWKLMRSTGARTYRIGDDYQSAYSMTVDLLKNQPSFIKIQKEMAEEFDGKPLSRTTAGETVCSELQKRMVNESNMIKSLKDRLSKGNFQNSQHKAELNGLLSESIARFEKYQDDLRQVERIPSWGEAIVDFGRRNAFSMLAQVGTTALQMHTHGNALAAANERAAAAEQLVKSSQTISTISTAISVFNGVYTVGKWWLGK